MVLTRCIFVIVTLGLALASAFISGCAAQTPCYVVVGYAPETLILLDECRGVLELRSLPKPSPRLTTSTTIAPETF